ncbi:unnamed protein product [Macrosiphum euphorbiae]|uniref:Uncharacterized protein n=1 Tax=Macrosiphum euphorbiae TaxID=13131 RepID=A0AAV0VM08_9HEMI|nr:unnamed protein product [Macrosiphum euphorbiae]
MVRFGVDSTKSTDVSIAPIAESFAVSTDDSPSPAESSVNMTPATPAQVGDVETLSCAVSSTLPPLLPRSESSVLTLTCRLRQAEPVVKSTRLQMTEFRRLQLVGSRVSYSLMTRPRRGSQPVNNKMAYCHNPMYRFI